MKYCYTQCTVNLLSVPLQVPDHIRKQTEEDLKKILQNDDDRAHPTVSLTEAQRYVNSHLLS